MLTTFIVLTMFLFAARFIIDGNFLERRLPINSKKICVMVLYLVAVILSQSVENAVLVNKLCNPDGKKSYTFPVVLTTIIPNLLIFSLLMVLLIIFPGWKGPFSNTIGYGISIFMGIKDSFNNLLTRGGTSEALMQKIMEDKSIIINEMDTQNFLH